MRTFGTRGTVRSDRYYVVPRTQEIQSFIDRVKDGRYIVLFAPRQTGKTTFFRLVLAALVAEDPTYFPIQLDFQAMRDATPEIFYNRLYQMLRWQIQTVFQKRGEKSSEALTHLLENTGFTDSFSMIEFFKALTDLLEARRVVLLIDEFDGIPQTLVGDFLYTLRYIYISDEILCPYSVGIVGVKNITQLNYDQSVSPFNIQDEFHLPNFTLEQGQDLFGQYTAEVGQPFLPEVIASIHKQTAGQPFPRQ